MFTSDRIEPFLNSLSLNGCSDNTIRAYRADLTGFLEWAGPMGTPENAQAVAQQYVTMHRMKWAPKTTKRKLASLRAFGRFEGVRILDGYRAPKPAKPMPHPIPEGINGVLEMIQMCDTQEQKGLIALCGLAGLRVTEARTLLTRTVFPPVMQMTVQGKGDHYRVVPISKLCWAFVGPLHHARIFEPDTPLVGQMADRTARAMITRMGNKAALSRSIRSHDLRATFATAMYAKCKDLRVVQEVLGHADSGTTEVYTGLSMDAMRDAVELL